VGCANDCSRIARAHRDWTPEAPREFELLVEPPCHGKKGGEQLVAVERLARHGELMMRRGSTVGEGGHREWLPSELEDDQCDRGFFQSTVPEVPKPVADAVPS
jgi:hypothetical protein